MEKTNKYLHWQYVLKIYMYEIQIYYVIISGRVSFEMERIFGWSQHLGARRKPVLSGPNRGVQ